MMNKQTEALKMAIEALEQACGLTPRDAHFCKAIQACKEALEQPQEPTWIVNNTAGTKFRLHQQPAQEPVAWMRSALDNARDVCKYLDHNMIEKAKAHTEFFWNDLDKIREFDDTHPAPSWQELSDDEIQDVDDILETIRDLDTDSAEKMLMEFKSKRLRINKSKDLSNAEIDNIWTTLFPTSRKLSGADMKFARAIEQALKENNT